MGALWGPCGGLVGVLWGLSLLPLQNGPRRRGKDDGQWIDETDYFYYYGLISTEKSNRSGKLTWSSNSPWRSFHVNIAIRRSTYVCTYLREEFTVNTCCHVRSSTLRPQVCGMRFFQAKNVCVFVVSWEMVPQTFSISLWTLYRRAGRLFDPHKQEEEAECCVREANTHNNHNFPLF